MAGLKRFCCLRCRFVSPPGTVFSPLTRVSQNPPPSTAMRTQRSGFGTRPTPRTTCTYFDVVRRSNSYGARDIERSPRSTTPRAVVLGDSFVEGIGVELGERVTDLLEKGSGAEYLNFGTAGNFSSIQRVAAV
jgi:hypothetical protein